MEAKLHKLKVTELKELLAKHHLVQTGKKDDLIKRLLDNNVTIDEDEGAVAGDEEELVDVDADTNDTLPDTTSTSAPAPQTVGVPAVPAPSEETPSVATTNGNGADGAPAPASAATISGEEGASQELTTEQKAMKARAERFGIPFNPNPTPKSKQKNGNNKSDSPKTTATATATAAPSTTQQPEKEKGKKAAAIDSNPLGLSQEVLDKRAAKFGLPEKKVEPAAPASAPKAVTSATKPASKALAAEPKKKEEISPELAEKIAIEEEKKRKRAEKFGTAAPAKPASSTAANGNSEPVLPSVR
ncbi:hypothetical protein I317_07211 [Kwoniella heveanensis CBS 569]|uniref:SAP domain-containing protein n=1 Tax=Kwoniella heveanensis BCC8398 TaxID=1296120 RepID=A0A1B9H4J9_9TREE|nr:hypothetical protein I316_00417 [Kwoniella heveanensis BCC8398]OCF38994.1 hypothetical protein I317_07211 [Kwoniella heveanensis CBS 569]